MELNNEIKNEKNEFFNSFIGKTINSAIDIGLRTVLPDLIEDQIIEIKDSLLQNGLKDGIKTAVNSAIDFGKSSIGIFTGNFENITQVKMAINDGGIIDSLSDIIDYAIEKTYRKGYINKTVSNIIKDGKGLLLENISNNIKKELDNQTNIIEKLERYTANWKEYYNNRNFEGMEKEYSKIQSNIDKIIPLDNIVKEINEIVGIHNLIKNNGNKFDITEPEKTLSINLNE